jgi:prepilin-type N-terminal cleavage/methylation domain-containing protein/prepilin-type processing-associated H-X9-DG protein
MAGGAGTRAGFTRLELLVVLVVLALLAAIQLPLLARSREPGNKAVCANNLRRLAAATLMFSAENSDALPKRTGPDAWPAQLFSYFQQTNVLHCPSDAARPANFGAGRTNADGAPRSYIMNGCNDYYGAFNVPFTSPVPLAAIQKPSETVLFGEKKTDSFHWWFDYNQFDDVNPLDQSRHFPGPEYGNTLGGSNYAFADGGVRFLRFGESFNPVNRWFLVEEWRILGTP